MGTEDVSITEIRQPEELLAFIKENDISIVMTDKEAEMLLGYMEGHDYVVGFAEERLYRGDLDDVPGEIVWDDDFSVDDLIDTVCVMELWGMPFFLCSFLPFLHEPVLLLSLRGKHSTVFFSWSNFLRTACCPGVNTDVCIHHSFIQTNANSRDF